jgi:aminocarboxymuconate-semialdehyde decarboxylase
MVIDWHAHVYPPGDAARPFWRGRCPMTIENVLELQEQAGIDLTVLSNTMSISRSAAEARQDRAALQAQTLTTVERANRYLAEVQNRFSGKVVGLASCLPCGGDAFLREVERAVVQDGLHGVFITSSHDGSYPDDDEALPFFDLVTRLDIPVMLHPPAAAFGEERMRDYRLLSSIGRPADSCLALARLIVRGIFEKFPTLKLIGTHLGGGICEVIGRMDYAYNLIEESFFLGPYEPVLIKHPPSHYLKRMYLDSVCYHVPAAQCAVDTVGADRFLFGTDAPPMNPLKRQGLDLVRQLDLSPSEQEKVLGGNACKLLKMG